MVLCFAWVVEKLLSLRFFLPQELFSEEDCLGKVEGIEKASGSNKVCNVKHDTTNNIFDKRVITQANRKRMTQKLIT